MACCVKIMPDIAPPSGPLVAVLVYDGLCTFEFGVAYEVFGLPRPEMGVGWYRYATAAIEPGPLRAAGGLMVGAGAGLEVLAQADLIVVPGWRGIATAVPSDLIAHLQAAHARGARVMSLCSGIAVLAACGFLDQRAATTHWRYAGAIGARHPDIRLDPDRLYVDLGDVLTAAGSAAGIDLCLHVVRRDFGPDIANAVARRLVVPPHRDGGQAQFIERPMPREREAARLGPLIDWLRRNLGQTHRIETIAARSGMSARTFQRRFEETTGLPPGEWLVAERVRLAREQLERSRSATLDDIAVHCGFGSLETMRHHFRKRVGVSPAAYRARFAGSSCRS
ncbi:transcriptional regulator FtrA [Labrys miyagiensis]|uniref:Transcriptional regulator FtrA n=1 Tax=Labrys miyagiensis TaxID=346912 RepID=A0ABQ6CVT9_9HYPH|nr:transcriptional regulator FtrA [Labrys miyagiensis]GLS23910.1 transcriptional regulator FtrA [Labrys miyagiensis]